jgi:sec-independent protein translocase protein TatC
MSATSAPPQPAGHMTLIEHLAELRTRIIRTMIALSIAGVVAWFLYEPLFDLLRGPLDASAPNTDLITTEPLQGFQFRLQMTAYTAVALAFPVILWQIWRFVAPALYSNERRYAVAFIACGTVLFAIGAAIAFWTMPEALTFLQNIGGEDNFDEFYTPNSYMRLIVYMMVAFGIGFQFPLIVTSLNMMGVVTTAKLREVRRYVIVIIAVFVAVATPSGDPISMLALTIPMVIFYEIAIVIGRIRERRLRVRGAA